VFRDWFKPRRPNRPPTGSVPAAHVSLDTVLGGKAQFEGNLKAQGSVRVEGTFLGSITTRGKISIGEAARVEGNVVGEAVSVSGTLRGDVTARKVYVTRLGRIWGDLTIQALATEEGGFIQGLITMEEKVDLDRFFPVETRVHEEKAEEKKPEPAKEAPSKAAAKR
jgi:cytoskeletal protein CcmA (bactofilin family)